MSISTWLHIANTVLTLGVLLILTFSIIVSVVPTSKAARFAVPAKIVLIIASIGSVAGPLLYQYFFGFPACTFCWYQRIFMWPIAFLAIGTLWQASAGRKHVLSAIKWLAPAGLFFSVWHYISQWGLTSTAAACGAVGQSVSCDGIDVIVWGFMTIPLMAGLGFISLFLLLRFITKTNG